MKSPNQASAASVSPEATAHLAEHATHIGTPNGAGLFYAACSRDYDDEICGCPICQRAAHDHE